MLIRILLSNVRATSQPAKAEIRAELSPQMGTNKTTPSSNGN